MVFLQLIKFSLVFFVFSSILFSQTKRAIFEGTPATNNAIFIQTTTPRVGINTNNPVYTLDVNGDINFTGELYKNGVLFPSSSTTIINTENFNYEFYFSTADVSVFKKLTNIFDLSDIEYIEKITNVNDQLFESFVTSFTFGSNEILSNKLEIEIFATQTQGESDISLYANVYKVKNNVAISVGSTNTTEVISKSYIGKYKMSIDLGLENFDNSQLLISLFCLVSGTTSVNNKLKVYFGRNFPSKVKIFYIRNFGEVIEGDNLGNHIATTSLNMNNYNITNANNIYANYFYGDGSNLTNISGDNLGNHTATQDLNLNNYNLNFYQTHDIGTKINANYPISFVIAGSTKAKINIYGIGVNGAEATGSYNVNVNGGVNSSLGFFVNGNPIPTTGDNLGNHTATQDLNLNLKNIKKATKISSGIDEYGFPKENPSFSGDFLGDLAVQKGKLIISSISLNYTDTDFNRFNYIEWGQSCYPLNVYSANMAVDDGQFGTAYNGCSTENYWWVKFSSFSNIVNLPDNAVIVGIEAKIKGYSSGTKIGSYLRLCDFNGASCYPYYDTSIVSNYDIPNTPTTLYFGGPNNTWGRYFTPTQARRLGLDIEFILQPYTTFYVDAIQLKVYYITGNFYDLKSEGENLKIRKGGINIVEISTNGINVIGEYYKNGVLFSGGSGSGDNLGNHIATKTLDMSGFSIINVSSINITGINVSGSDYLFKVANDTFVILNDGRVGIKKSNPTAQLDVNGDVKASTISANSMCLNGNCITNWSSGSGGYTSFVIDDFSSQCNGSQKTFTLSQQPLENSLQISKNGLVLKSTDDYTLSGQIVTLVSAPNSGDKLLAQYAVGVSTDEVLVIQDGLPIGTIIPYSSTIPPQGYLYCDGSWVSKNSYPELFSVIGHKFSTFTPTGDYFQLPDLRGMFLRGDDTYNNKGRGYMIVGSTQIDTLQGHSHEYYNSTTNDNTIAVPFVHSGGPTGYATTSAGTVNIYQSPRVTEPRGNVGYGEVRISSETRPINTVVAFHIKYANIGTSTIKLSSSNVILTTTNTWTGTNTFNNNTIFNSSITINSNISLNGNINNQYIGYVDLTNATNDYLLKRGERAYITFTNATSVPLRIQTFSGTAYKLVYFLSNNYGNSGANSNAIFLNPNNNTYTNQFVYREIVRNENGLGNGAYTYSSFRIGWAFSNGFVYLYNYTTNKRLVGEGNIWGLSLDLSSIISFACAWSDTTTQWTSLGTVTFPQASSGVIVVERIF